MELMLAHWLFADVPLDQAAPLISASRIVGYRASEVIFNEGDAADGLYIIAAGSVRIAATSERGPVLLASLGPDEVFGEIGVLDGEPRSGTAIATRIVTCHFLPRDPFLSLLGRSSAVSRHFLILLSDRVRRLNGRMAELPLSGVPPALAAAS
jgi:CRP-like cAMP-binding protein